MHFPERIKENAENNCQIEAFTEHKARIRIRCMNDIKVLVKINVQLNF